MTTITNQIQQGDTLSFTTSVPAYPPNTGWTLTYSIRGAVNLDLVATVQGSLYQITASSAQTAALTPGTYYWVAYVSGNGQRYTVDRGQLTVTPDLISQAAGYDGRSQARKALDDANTALATWRSSAGRVKSYTIADRTMVFEDASQILTQVHYWKAIVRNEEAAAQIAQGLGNPRKLFTRFS